MTPPTPAEVFAELGALPAAEVAATIAAAGHGGRPGYRRRCPVAVYVHHRTGIVVGVSARVWSMPPDDLWQRADNPDPPPTTGPVPDSVSDVVLGIDLGEYPQLCDPTTTA